eukprot:GGOE01006065.1.p1 GENE.GGOE01006065.1~~GGOE01006065.1.p1  ORF type:complete len:1002 (+),score=287.58 GGOE01006065.1:95-3100(+)
MHVLHSVADCLAEQPGQQWEYALMLRQEGLQPDVWHGLLTALQKFTTIVELDLSNTQLDDWQCEDLCQALLANASPLRVLGLGGNVLGPVAADGIAAYVSDNQWLQAAHLEGNRLGNVGATLIAQAAAGHHSLTELDLSQNDLTDTGTQPLMLALQQIPSLTTLSLRGNELGDAAAYLLGAMLPKCALASLDLSQNMVGSEGCTHLAMGVRQRSCLVKLSLAENCVGESGAKAFVTAVQPGSSLKSLDLSGNCISAGVCLRLAAEAVKEDSPITSLNVANNALSMDDCAAIFNACHGAEGCTVVFAPAGGDLMYTQFTWAQQAARMRGKKHQARSAAAHADLDSPRLTPQKPPPLPSHIAMPELPPEPPVVSLSQLHRTPSSNSEPHLQASLPADGMPQLSHQASRRNSAASFNGSQVGMPGAPPLHTYSKPEIRELRQEQVVPPAQSPALQPAFMPRTPRADHSTQYAPLSGMVPAPPGSSVRLAAFPSQSAGVSYSLPGQQLATVPVPHPSGHFLQPSIPQLPAFSAPQSYPVMKEPVQPPASHLVSGGVYAIPYVRHGYAATTAAVVTPGTEVALVTGAGQQVGFPQCQGIWMSGPPLSSPTQGGMLYTDSTSLSRSDTTNATQMLSAVESRSTGTSSSLQTGPLPVKNGLGKPIGPEHPNYALMRCIQRGIQHGIGRQTDSERQPLDRDVDFQDAKVKYILEGKEVEDDVQFTDYAPKCFLRLRETFGLDPEEYLRHLCASIWTESTAGKSTAMLYFAGSSFVIKTTSHEESKFLRRILYDYYEHCESFPLTLIPHFLGHHAIKLPGRRKLRFVIMNNVFNTSNKIHIKYDLKGSRVGRTAKVKEPTSSVILKDQDILENKHWMHLGRRKEILLRQIKADTKFLAAQAIMDYSFLLGIHRVGEDTDTQGCVPLVTAKHVREREEFCFLADGGGMQREGAGHSEVYYFGIIDILQEYTLRKRGETLLRSVQYGKKGVSAVPPDYYALRFSRFLARIMV